MIQSYDTYISFFLSRPPAEVWTIFLLALARIVPLVTLAPFLGGKILSDPMKIGFGIALTPIFLPPLLLEAHPPTDINLIFFFLLIKELVIGAILGFLITIPFHFAQGAGTLIDHQGGSQSLQVFDPTLQSQATPTGILYNNVMIAAFFSIGGPILFFDAVLSSYKLIPADAFIGAAFFSKHAPLWHTTTKLITTLFTIVLQLSAPSVIAILLSDLFLGIANRMAPQVQISFLLWSLKAFLGLLALYLGWWLILKQMDIQGLAWTKMIYKMVSS